MLKLTLSMCVLIAVSNANAAVDTIDLAGISHLKIDKAVQVEWVIGEQPALKITPQDDGQPVVSRSGNQLLLASEKRNNAWYAFWESNYGGVSYQITLPSLDAISINGASELNVDTARLNQLTFEVNGASKVKWSALDAKKINLTINGASKVQLDSLKSESLTMDINGASLVEIKQTAAAENNIVVNGASAVALHNIESDQAKFDLNGASKLKANAGYLSQWHVSINGASKLLAATVDGEQSEVRVVGASKAELGSFKALSLEAKGASSISYADAETITHNSAVGASNIHKR